MTLVLVRRDICKTLPLDDHDQCKTLPLDAQVEDNHPSPLMLKGRTTIPPP